MTRFLQTVLIAAVMLSAAPPLLAVERAIVATPAASVPYQDTEYGPKIAGAEGDFSKGAHMSFVRIPAGFVSPLHIHSHDYVGVVVAGVTRHYPAGGRDGAPDLAPGSVWSVPAELPHVTECLPEADCVMLIHQAAAFDLIPVK